MPVRRGPASPSSAASSRFFLIATALAFVGWPFIPRSESIACSCAICDLTYRTWVSWRDRADCPGLSNAPSPCLPAPFSCLGSVMNVMELCSKIAATYQTFRTPHAPTIAFSSLTLGSPTMVCGGSAAELTRSGEMFDIVLTDADCFACCFLT